MIEDDIKRLYYDRGFKDGEASAHEALCGLLQNPLTRKLIVDMASKEIKPEDLQKEIDKHIKELS